ncbi:MAG: hypothetical protein IH906_04970 [Proteobacteria bacterium]|nr:hypothetical protein [Pseudomonadota bacterium]
MSDIQEIHGAPLSSPRDEQSGLPQVAASRVKAGVTLTGRWFLDEMRGWYDRRMAAHELSHVIHRLVDDGRVRYRAAHLNDDRSAGSRRSTGFNAH